MSELILMHISLFLCLFCMFMFLIFRLGAIVATGTLTTTDALIGGGTILGLVGMIVWRV